MKRTQNSSSISSQSHMEFRAPARKPKNVYHIGGIGVEFPYQPYGSQLAFMGRVISTLDRAQRDGHCHALLESPTGTGKSLSLLCSALAWQQNHQSRNLSANPAHLRPAPEAWTDPLAYGGGFLPETQPPASGNPEPAASVTSNKASKKKTAPTIFYASRTHSQLTQVIREYRKTTYRVPMSILASRKHYCTNKHVHGKDNIDEECKMLLNNQEEGCSEFKNVHKVKGHPSLKKGGCHEIHDIEDLVKVGQDVKGCSYFAARSMADDAQIVFCPYNYIVNPVIRKAMEVDIRGAILIFDEAHNIEDMARDGGSVVVDEDVLHKLQTELGQLTFGDPMIYQPLHEMIQDIVSWMEQRKNTLEKREFQHYFSCFALNGSRTFVMRKSTLFGLRRSFKWLRESISWSGDKALRELQEANITQQCFPILQDCATKAIKAASDTELGIAHLTGMSATTLEGLFSSLNYFFSGNGVHMYDYQLALQRYVKRDAGNAAGGWTNTLSLWCLNPAVVFRDIADLSLSVILTSGTLSPMNSFSSELGVQFGTCLEAPHVIDVESQLWAAVISTGPGNYPLNACYKTADGYAFQDALGKSLEEICKIVPGGSLIFFPSYKLMEKLCNRWRETGQWSRLNALKSLFIEPRGGSQDDLEPVLMGYYNSIRRSKKPALGRRRRGKRLGLGNSGTMECTDNFREGAAFLAVCRGKVSEGIDFSDENARAVIIVGIPFPNINDIQIAQKKKYNDTYKSSRNLLSGSEWYCHQTFRALNQAAGRCIRHKFDYGAIILLDERFREERNITYISKWIRKSIKQYDSFDKSLEELKSFFSDVKERVGKEADNMVQISDVDVENISAMNQGKGFTGKKNQKVNKSNKSGLKLISNGMMAIEKTARFVTEDDVTSIKSKSEDNAEVQASSPTDVKHTSSSREYVDQEFSSRKDFRCSMTFTNDVPEVSIVKETLGVDGSLILASPGSFSKDENSSSTVIQVPTEFPDQSVLHSTSLSNSNAGPFEYTCSFLATPQKNVTADANSLLAETEGVLNLSVNSHTHKRRKSLGSTLVNHIQVEQFDDRDPKTPGHGSFMASSRTIKDGCSQNKFEMPGVPQLLAGNNGWALCNSSSQVMDKRLQIFCSLCRNPLGLPENHLYVRCSTTFSSKTYLATLMKERFEAPEENKSTGIPVVISDISSVDKRLCNRTHEDAQGQGIWSREDGCVFNTIFCPFCSNHDNCLGVQVMATDASNVQLLNKILFCLDCLEIKNLEASKDSSPVCGQNCADPFPIEKFAYIPLQQMSNGWRTTRSKMQLTKRGLLAPQGLKDES